MSYPIIRTIDYHSGAITPECEHTVCVLADMKEMYLENTQQPKTKGLTDNPIVYETRMVPSPPVGGNLSYCTTVIHPGLVGGEFFMTRGHYHVKDTSEELYFCLKGTGVIITGTQKGDFKALDIDEGSLVRIPPRWAHRVVNTDEKQDLIVLAMFAADAGHCYEDILGKGFKYIVCKAESGYRLVLNPRFSAVE